MILVTGATGKVGGELIRLLAARGESVRALTRDPANASFPAGVSVAEGDAGNEEALRAALDGIDSIFFMAPDVRLPAHAEILAKVARPAGLRHIALLSSLSVEMAGDNPLAVEHRAAEAIIRDSGCTWTMLRGGVFASNTLAWSGQIRRDGVVRSILRNHPFAPVAPEDIASVAAEALLGSGHDGNIYGLTGRTLITPAEQVEILGSLLSRKLEFIELDEPEALAAFLKVYPRQTEATFHALRQEDVPWMLPRQDIEQVTGRAARDYREWAELHIEAFRA